MITLNYQEVVDWLSKLGFGGLLVLALLGFQQGWWFFGREREEWKRERDALIKDRDEWKARALTALATGERTVSVATSVLPAPEAHAS